MQKIENAADNAAFTRDAAWVSSLLSQVQKQRFFGEIVLKFDKGVLMRAHKNQSLMPPHRETSG